DGDLGRPAQGRRLRTGVRPHRRVFDWFLKAMQTRGKHRWHPIPLPPQPLSGRYCFTVDTPCDACGYNLRSLPLDARCPECGTPASLGAQTLPHHWPAEVRWRLAAIIAAALVSPALRLVWVSVLLLGFLDSADVGTLRAIA